MRRCNLRLLCGCYAVVVLLVSSGVVPSSFRSVLVAAICSTSTTLSNQRHTTTTTTTATACGRCSIMMMTMASSAPSSSRPSCRFITNKMCPFAQKAWIALEAAGANYQLEQVSLYGPGGKPDWFWKLNPKGQVPVLVISSNNKEVVLADSDLILDEIHAVVGGDRQLYDTCNDEVTAQTVRAFRKCLAEFLPIGKKAMLGGGSKNQMWSKLQELDGLMRINIEGGPYYVAGTHLTVADCAAFPFLWRLQQEYGNNIWEEHNCSNISKWLDHCSGQPAFSKTIQSSWWWWW